MIRSKKTIWVILLAAIVAMPSTSAFATDYYVATDGNDSDAGTIGAPFATIQKAADSMAAGDTCYIRGGTYRETVDLNTPGNDGNTITFTNYRADEVTVDGTDILDLSWSVHSGNIYKATTTKEFDQLFVDGEMMVEARWPNITEPGGIFNNSSWATVGSGSLGTLTDTAISGTGINWVGAYGAFNLSQQMHTWIRKVKTHNSNTITYDTNGIDLGLNASWDDDRYYLFGKLDALDIAGEWFLDTDSNTVYLWTKDGDSPANHTIEIKQRDYSFDADPNTDYIEISGLNFFGCEFRFQENCHYITVDDCHLLYPNFSRTIPTMYAGGSAQNSNRNIAGHHITVKNCSIAYSLISAIFLKGSYITFENNFVHDALWNGSNTFAAVLILSGDADPNFSYADGNSLVSNNTIYNVGNVGIKVKQKNSLVQYNDISRGGLNAKDTTLLYTAGLHPDTAFQYNWLHDTKNFNNSGLGLRLDGNPTKTQVEDVIIRGNVTWNCAGKGFIIKGLNHRVYNNTVTDGITLLYDTHDDTEIYNNYASGFTYNYGASQGGVGYFGYNSTTSTPGFEDKDLRNFEPQSSSVLVDSGISTRPGYSWTWNGDDPDKGAYERGEDYWVPGYIPIRAYDPYPNIYQENVDPNTTFAWESSSDVNSYDIYLGTSYSSVVDANTSSGEYETNQTASTYNPASLLTASTTYYWRIDCRDVNDNLIAYGDVWEFETGPTGTYYHPIAWYRFDEGSGTTTADASINRNTAFVTDVGWVDGKTGGALSFSGADYVSVPVDDLTSISDQVTITLWQYGDAADQPQDDVIFQAVNSSGNRLLNVHLPWGNGSVYWDAGYASGSYDRINKSATASEYEGQWNHWAFTKNTNTGSMKIYVNGELWHSGTGKTKSMSGIATFKIGAADDGTNNYDGKIDDFRVYDVELDVNDINDIYTEGIPQAVTSSFNPSDDTYIKEAQPTSNYGTDVYIRIRQATDLDCFGYLKFTVTGVSGTVTSAKLKMRTEDVAIDDTKVYAVTGSWDEDTLTWNIANADLTWGSLLDTKNNVSANTWHEFDVSNHITGNGTYTLGLKTTDNQGYKDWSTKESEYDPVLEVEYIAESNAPGKASGPSPANSAAGVDVNDNLSWSAAADADNYDVYFGTSSPCTLQGNQTGTTFELGTMDANTTYYWRIDPNNEVGITTGDVWSFTTAAAATAPDQATNPSPANSATSVDVNDNLSWTAATGADDYDVYFGTSSPGSFQGNQTGVTFEPGTMDANTTYYWRIDPNNEAGTTTGDVWSFTTKPDPVTLQLNPTDDAYVNQAHPDVINGAKTVLLIRNLSGSKKYGYIKFSVTGVSGTVTSAKLKLKVENTAINNTSVYVVTSSWDEDTITWNNDDLSWGSLLETKTSLSANTWYEFDVSAEVDDNGTYTLGLKTTDTTGYKEWYSKESAYDPVLEIIYQP